MKEYARTIPKKGGKSLVERVILHCDMNGFYASVEGLEYPELQEKPFAVCGDPHSRRGIILAKNEIAKQYGVKTAETIWQAKKKCPSLVLLPAHHDKYAHYSKLANAIYRQYTDRVEPCSIDESWLDVTQSRRLFGDGKEIADTLRKRMKQELGLSISVGVSFNKIFAKMGSDYKKPDATTVITKENFQELLYPLPVSDMISIGHSAAEKLKAAGIETIGQLAAGEVTCIKRILGKAGETVYAYANGEDPREVALAGEKREIKSVGNSMTFRRNLIHLEELRSGVVFLSDTVAGRLRENRKKCWTVQVTLRDPEFRDRSKQKKLSHATNLEGDIAKEAMSLVQALWKPGDAVRLIAVTAAQLQEETQIQQLTFWEDTEGKQREKREKLERTIDSLRNRYGKQIVQFGSSVGNELVEKTVQKPEVEEGKMQ